MSGVPDHLDVNGRRYAIERLLGKGKGGYSYLATLDGWQAVVKQIHHEPCDYYEFGDKLEAELGDYRLLTDLGIPMPELLDVDRDAERLVKEYVPGDTVYRLVLEGRLPEGCLLQMRRMCQALYPAGINIDYFPTNFIWRGGVLWYVDYECNPYDPRWDFEHWGCQYWTRTPQLVQYAKEHPLA